ncbi:Ferritin-like domain-containing protein [Sulfidibacter corallicola]|uniref:Iminophenyl-pyruvate dimer synthase domain-containing protein n=1 Tax=Sulfidibacter corallicola TaxID=2818388 RepID=A0A8A4TL09_SULCO|nr:ferritin-like protein [Sulfidibacter corallicola]QTD50263.1 hypothetical protein J3U87_32155 [Sulfidibacter corallicola]
MKKFLSTLKTPITNRDLSNVPNDTAVVRAIAQAALEVELFTIPLYMVAMHSLQGMHEINSNGVDYYQGRVWPGLAPSASPQTDNQKAYNTLFSVFIEEMVHLQVAANLANGIGAIPVFTNFQNAGWKVYGPQNTVIPHIIDLADTTAYAQIKVQLGPLDEDQLQLFLAIEENHDLAKEKIINPSKYFPTVPFNGVSGLDDLPMFGTIGWMYACYWDYLSMSYTDGETLFEKIFSENAIQRDIFNGTEGTHQMEYPNASLAFKPDGVASNFARALDMISAITDQGEGSVLGADEPIDTQVLSMYRASPTALASDYPSYDSSGALSCPSADATARTSNDGSDHYERFNSLGCTVSDLELWTPGKTWCAEDFVIDTIEAQGASGLIPSPDAMAAAFNQLSSDDTGYVTLSQALVGAISGVTTVLDQLWKDNQVQFPFPAMAGTGDRTSICWAIYGRAPDLTQTIPTPDAGHLQHACQGLSLDGGSLDPEVATFHSCRGSNQCKTQGGCGFVQPSSGGGQCGASQALMRRFQDDDTSYSAPADNKCSTLGGCAVPISASQLYPSSGTMSVYDFDGQDDPILVGPLPFQTGDSVYDTAWNAFTMIMEHRGQPPGDKPAPSNLRIALPPST